LDLRRTGAMGFIQKEVSNHEMWSVIQLVEARHVKTVLLGGTDMSQVANATWQQLASVMAHQHIRVVDLSCTNLDDFGFSAILSGMLSLQHTPRDVTLSFRGNKMKFHDDGQLQHVDALQTLLQNVPGLIFDLRCNHNIVHQQAIDSLSKLERVISGCDDETKKSLSCQQNVLSNWLRL